MAGKYITLYSLPSPSAIAGAPVLISKGELLMDRFSEKLFVRVIMKSLDEREIHSAQISLQLFDEVGAPLESAVQYCYHSLKAKRDNEFGGKKLIALPNSIVRSFTVVLENVTFSDYSSWDNDTPFQNIGRMMTLEEAFASTTMAKQFEAQYGSDCRYMPEDKTVVWYCACGGINRADEERCHICRRKRTALQELNYEALRSVASEAEEREQNVLIREKEAKKRIETVLFRIAMIVLPVLLVSALILATVPSFLEKQREYQQAAKLLKERQYDEAIAAFEALDNYRDSALMAEKEVPYQKALLFLENAKNPSAADLSAVGLSISEFTDEDAIRLVLYHRAESLLEEITPYKDAEDKLSLIQQAFDDYRDKLIEAEYNRAVELLEKEAYLKARDAFLSLGGYRNSLEMAQECLYRRAISVLRFCENNNVRHISLAISRTVGENTRVSMPGSVLTELGSDRVYELKKCFVEDGVEFLYEDLPGRDGYLPICEAVAIEFENLGEYKDSSEKAQNAKVAGDFSSEFFKLLSVGNLEGAIRWLRLYDDYIPAREEYAAWLEQLISLCGEWELSLGDSTLIPFSAGVEYTKLDSFETGITIENNIATLHIIPPDGIYEAMLQAEFGEVQFSVRPDSTVYYAYLNNQIGRFIYIRYSHNGTVLSSCEYNRK